MFHRKGAKNTACKIDLKRVKIEKAVAAALEVNFAIEKVPLACSLVIFHEKKNRKNIISECQKHHKIVGEKHPELKRTEREPWQGRFTTAQNSSEE